MLPQAKDQFIERLVCLRGDLNSRETLVRPLLPDLYLRDLEAGAMGQDLIQHLGQDQRIDDVAAQFDRLRKHPQTLPYETARASRRRIRRNGHIDRANDFVTFGLCAR